MKSGTNNQGKVKRQEMAEVKAIVLRAAGINCDMETEYALELAGAKAQLNKPIGFELLPEKFTFPHLQTLYEVILDKNLDKRNFRKKIMHMNVLTKLNEKDRKGKKRPADLYKFNKLNYQKFVDEGMIFGI